MAEQKITIMNRAGIHARPAAVIVDTAKDFKSTIHLEKGNQKVNAKSILGIMTLGAGYGVELNIIAQGEDEEAAVAAMVRLFESRFEEE